MKQKIKNYCKDCNIEISEGATRCKYCYQKGDLNVMKRPGVKENHLKAMQNLQHREKIKTILNQPSVKEKRSNSMKEAWKNPIIKEKMLKEHNKPSCIERYKFAKLGSRNPAWNNGSSFADYSHNFNNQFKQLIFLRDNNCVICGSNKRLSCHHIDYNKLNTTKENCITLCSSCHMKTNFNRKYWKNFFQDMLLDKYNYLKITKEVNNSGTIL